MKKILISGGAGFIGSHTADYLLSKGYNVRILDSLLEPVHPNGKWPNYLNHEIEKIQGDVNEKSAWVKALCGVDAVIHLAAYQDLRLDFSKYIQTNVAGTALMYEVIVENKLDISRIIIGGSQAVYGEGKYCCSNSQCPETILTNNKFRYPPARSKKQLEKAQWECLCPFCHLELKWVPTDEKSVNPTNQYGVSKYSQELTALALGKQYSIPTIVMRYSIVQGTRQSFRNAYSGALRIFSQMALSRKSIKYFEDGNQMRDFTPIEDVIAANFIALTSNNSNFDVVNVGSGNAITIYEFANLVRSVANVDIDINCSGLFRYGDARNIVSSIEKLKSWGWEPVHSLKQTVGNYLEWAFNEPDWKDYYTDSECRMITEGTLRPFIVK